ncbi:carbamoyl phosphate synthase large subunit, partial [Micrococcus sp. SIMBA_144]
MSVRGLEEKIEVPTDSRFFELMELLRRGSSVADLHEKTGIDKLFLSVMSNLMSVEKGLQGMPFTSELLKKAKEFRFEDKVIAGYTGKSEADITTMRVEEGIVPGFKMVDTCAGEFEAITNYAYSTYYGSNEINPLAGEKKVLIVGAGPIRSRHVTGVVTC